MFKKILIAGVILMAVAGAGWGAIPAQINFQGKVTGIETNTPIEFAIYNSASSGTVQWNATSTLTKNSLAKDPEYARKNNLIYVDNDGIFNVVLGDYVKSEIPLSSLNYDVSYWIAVLINGVAMAPRQPLTTSPYAMTARNVLGGRVAAGAVTALDPYNPIVGMGTSDNGVWGDTTTNNYWRAGVYGHSKTTHGVYGWSEASGYNGVFGYNPSGTGVYGSGAVGLQAKNTSDSNLDFRAAIVAPSMSWGAIGMCSGNTYGGLGAKNSSGPEYGLYGISYTSGLGVYGESSGWYGV